MPVEDLGVSGIPYAMARDDLLHGNRDVLAACAALLAVTLRTAMKVTADAGTVTVATSGLDELETYLDGRPYEPIRAIRDGSHEISRPNAEAIEFVGRRARTVGQRRRVRLRGRA